MGIKLLDRTRRINSLLHNNNSYVVVFNDICQCLGDLLGASVIVTSAKGKILAIYRNEGTPLLGNIGEYSVGDKIDKEVNERFLAVLSTKENVNLETLGYDDLSENNLSAIIMPVDFAGKRMGTTFIFRNKKEFSVDDIILSEYANTVFELEMMRSIYEEGEEVKRSIETTTLAVQSLTDSEKRALKIILRELNGRTEGTIVASHLSKENKITRSIIVNAMQKLEGAGIFSLESHGMKGTHVEILNNSIYKEVDFR